MDWKEFIKKQRHNAQHYQKEGRGKDVEYGRYCGRLANINEVIDRQDVEVDPLQVGIRMCPGFGAICLGNFTPDCYSLVHGTEGCAFMLKLFMDGYELVFQEKGNILTTAVHKVDAILGGEDKLRKAILEVDQDYHPGMIIVFKTCAPSVIGDDIKGVCNSLKDKVGCRLVPVDVGSFASRHTAIGRNQFLISIADEFFKPTTEKIPNSVNLIGDNCALHPIKFRPPNDPEELERVLTDMGVTVHCRLPGREPLDKLTTFTSASLNVLVCGASGLEFARHMKESYDMPFVTVNRPIGIESTTQMYLAVIDALGLGAKAMKVLEREVTETDKALEPYRNKLNGKRFAVSLSTGRFIGQVLMGMELGMEPVLLSIHSLHEKLFAGLDILNNIFTEKGYEPEVITEANYYEEAEYVDRLKPDVWFIDGTEKNISVRFGIPYVNSMAETFDGPQLGYKGCLSWAAQAARAVENADIYRKMAAPHSRLRYQPENA